MDGYIEILKEWEQHKAIPAVYEHLDKLFPQYGFLRLLSGSPRDHWASRRKLDLNLPKVRNAEKTVVYRSDMCFREQGDWTGSAIGIIDKLIQDRGFKNVYEAFQWIDHEYSLGMPQANGEEIAAQTQAIQRRKDLLYDLLTYFAWNLENNVSAKAAAVRKYLKEQRGFSLNQASNLNLGFVPDWNKVIRYMTDIKKYTLEELDKACGVRNYEGKTTVGKTHTLAIPYKCGGVLKGFLFRRTEEGTGPKYIASAELDRKSVFFNISADKDEKEIVVVEGEFDALKATEAGIPNVVAIGGAEIAGERKAQITDAFRRGVKKITLCLDLDELKNEPGKPNTVAFHRHVMRSIHTIRDINIEFDDICVCQFPYPSDPDEYIRKEGVDAFRHLLTDAVPYWKYLFEYKENS